MFNVQYPFLKPQMNFCVKKTKRPSKAGGLFVWSENMRRYNRNKYNARTVVYDGITFDSVHERNRYIELKELQEVGEISGLRLQVPYEIIPAQREPDIIGKRGGVKRGKTIERNCEYVADFVYFDKYGELVVEDAKGYKDGEAYKLFVVKRKLMLQVHGIRVQEV